MLSVPQLFSQGINYNAVLVFLLNVLLRYGMNKHLSKSERYLFFLLHFVPQQYFIKHIN